MARAPVSSPAASPLLVVISGCSGAGKSTLLAEMAARGVATAPEPGREVVRAETAAGGDGLPWADLGRFCALCVARAAADHAAATARGGVTLFDRSALDAVAALERAGLPIPEGVASAAAACRYASPVFLADPWPELFEADAERRHDLAAARAEHDHLARRYPQAGYAVEPLPKLPLAARADWLGARLDALEAAA